MTTRPSLGLAGTRRGPRGRDGLGRGGARGDATAWDAAGPAGTRRPGTRAAVRAVGRGQWAGSYGERYVPGAGTGLRRGTGRGGSAGRVPRAVRPRRSGPDLPERQLARGAAAGHPAADRGGDP